MLHYLRKTITIRKYLSKHSTSNLPLLLTGGAGVVSKDIDGKPFIDSLTRVMAEAYSYAKKGSKDSGKSVLTGTGVATRNKLYHIFLAPLSVIRSDKSCTDLEF